MHEVGVTTEMVELILERLAERGDVKVGRVVLEVGGLTALLPDSMRFCFDMIVTGTPLEGASLEIIETAGSELKIKEVEVKPCA